MKLVCQTQARASCDGIPTYQTQARASRDGNPAYQTQARASCDGNPAYQTQARASRDGNPAYQTQARASCDGNPAYQTQARASRDGNPTYQTQARASCDGNPTYQTQARASRDGNPVYQTQARASCDGRHLGICQELSSELLSGLFKVVFGLAASPGPTHSCCVGIRISQTPGTGCCGGNGAVSQCLLPSAGCCSALGLSLSSSRFEELKLPGSGLSARCLEQHLRAGGLEPPVPGLGV
ncbi:hypothetical protein P7K49_024649 [Saguinus oedipus]|uniref:Uncharacterized protein n=1 Tax=Saguinus oedipus TaxID=9490 RepID=A0ABQ9UQ44_SAGOE|nr:hypothetical protein P7K49_024649 [Saguinus oedipus]